MAIRKENLREQTIDRRDSGSKDKPAGLLLELRDKDFV
jgi:hypothetical protein